MTDKKEETSTEQEKKASFAVEGVDDLFKEALATMEMDSSALKDDIAASKENESEIIWEEPEIRDEEIEPSPVVDSEMVEKVQHLEAALTEANEGKEKEVAERKKVYEQLLRVTAEFDNFRKRTQREKEELRRFGHKDIMGDFLDVMDNFERALGTLGETEDSIREGIEMVHRQFSDILSRHGVKRFASTGEAFDYTKHQAISVFETTELAPQIVYETFKDGYEFHDRLLRPAMVVVSKAPAVATAPEVSTEPTVATVPVEDSASVEDVVGKESTEKQETNDSPEPDSSAE